MAPEARLELPVELELPAGRPRVVRVVALPAVQAAAQEQEQELKRQAVDRGSELQDCLRWI